MALGEDIELMVITLLSVAILISFIACAVNLWQACNGYNMPRSLIVGLFGLFASILGGVVTIFLWAIP